jgi:hypothetical protein
VVRGEHDAERGEDRVELAVDERERLGVTLDEGDIQPLRPRPLLAPDEQRLDVVEAVTVQNRRAAARLAAPFPQATSRTFCPARRSTDSQSDSPTMVRVVPMTA